MKHSEILAKVEESISGGILLGVMRVDSVTVTPNDSQITPETKVEPGKYGIVEAKILVPLKS